MFNLAKPERFKTMTKANTAIALVLPATEEKTVESHADKRANLMTFFREVGEMLANAQITKTEAAFRFRDACRDGLAHIARKGSDDAEKCYLAIANAHNAACAGRVDVDLLPCDAKSAKSAISIFRSFGRPAVINQGEDWFARVSRVRDLLGAECKLSAYMAMYRANNACQKAQDGMIGNKSFYATDGDISDWIINKPAEKDTASEAMDKFLKDMTTLSQDYDFGSDVYAAMEILMAAGTRFISDETARLAY
jgi:hypothetical protein